MKPCVSVNFLSSPSNSKGFQLFEFRGVQNQMFDMMLCVCLLVILDVK